LVKDYHGPEHEMDAAVQLVLTQVVSEDPRFLEQAPPPLSEEFPPGCRVFFLGEHAYGVAAQISEAAADSLSVVLALFPSEPSENDQFKEIVAQRAAARYFPSYIIAEKLLISPLALAKITSSLMIIGPDGQKTNVGLSLKFEGKAMKVLDYSRKEGRTWEYSELALDLLRDYKKSFPELFRAIEAPGSDMLKSTEVLKGLDPNARMREVRLWLSAHGVRDFEAVALSCDKLNKATVESIEAMADTISRARSPSSIKKVMIKGIPRQAVLKPSHAQYRLQNQSFSLGDRVVMVQDTGGVPLAAKGVVISLNSGTIDVVWDCSFMSGTSLQGRCSDYRGSTVATNSCLNLSRRQYVMSTKPQPPPGSKPVLRSTKPTQSSKSGNGVPNRIMHIVKNPNRVPQSLSSTHTANASTQVSNGPALSQGKPATAVQQPSVINIDPAVLHYSRGRGRGPSQVHGARRGSPAARGNGAARTQWPRADGLYSP